MNKKLIALAVAAAMVPMAAMAEVEVYGQGNVSIDVADNGAAAATAAASQNGINVSTNSSRIGFKASEDLGNGMSAVVVAEFGVNMASNGYTTVDDTASFTDRNTYVGIAGDFGTVIVGRVDTPYKSSTKNMGVFGDTTADYRAVVGMQGNYDFRADNAIAFLKTVNDNISFAVAYVPDSNDNNTDEAVVTGSFNYNSDMFDVAVGYLGMDSNGAGDEVTAMRVGGTYSINDDINLNLVYDNVVESPVAGPDTADFASIYLSGSFASGDNTFAAAFGTTEDDTTGAVDSAGTFMAFGVTHDYSETTKVYAIYASMDNTASTTYGLGGSQGLQLAGVNDETATSLSFGISTKF